MRAYPVALIALALLAGSAGYITHRVLTRVPAQAVLTQADDAQAFKPAALDPSNPLEWSFYTLEGQQRRLGEWPGKVVVLNFWATWCGPCLREIPAFIALQEQYADQGLQFVGIALDQAPAVSTFVSEKGVNYPVVIGDDDVVRLMQHLGNQIGALPYTAVLTGDGQVSYTHQGEWAADEAEEVLLSFMKMP